MRPDERRGGPGPRLIPRPRVDDLLARRTELALIAIEAPAGYGVSTLLRDAVERGPSALNARDVLIECGGAVVSADQLGETMQRLEAACPPNVHLTFVLDDVHLLNPAAHQLLADSVSAAGEHRHFVLAGRPLPALNLPALLADRRAAHLGPDELALDPELRRVAADGAPDVDGEEAVLAWPLGWGLSSIGRGDLVVDALRDIAARDLDDAGRRAVAVMALVGGGDSALSVTALGAVGVDETALGLVRWLPLCDLVDGGVWPDSMWHAATKDVLTKAQVSDALVAAARHHLAAGRFQPAGELAIRANVPDVLAAVVRAALDSLPARASDVVLIRWSASGLLEPGSAEDSWLLGMLDVRRHPHDGSPVTRFEAARLAYAANSDVASETAVLLHLGALARRIDDGALLMTLLARAHELAPHNARARALAQLGEALGAQLVGESGRAVELLEAVPAGLLAGDWECQHQMMLGTNLALSGHPDEGLVALRAAAGAGSPWVRAVAHDLAGSVRWSLGDVDGALEDARTAEILVTEGNAVDTERGMAADLYRAARRCYAAFAGDQPDREPIPLRRGFPPDEVHAFETLAAAADCVGRGDLDAARRRLGMLAPPPTRVVRSTLFRVALEMALLPEARDQWEPRAAASAALRPAVAAGRAAIARLDSGVAVPEVHRPFVPAVWCNAAGSRINIRLLGTPTVTSDGQLVTHPSWNRGRVRELCLHLATEPDTGREQIAAALWPELPDAAATRNLRVTLSYLLDVVDPDRARGQGSELISETGGSLRFAVGPRVRIDVVAMAESAAAVIDAALRDDELVTLAAARRMLAAGHGTVFGGAPVGDWFEPVRRRLNDQVLRAVGRAGSFATRAGDHELAEALGRRGLELDPWSERSHELVAGALLAAGNLDAARRALRLAVDELAGLGVSPSVGLSDLIRHAGLRFGPR